MKISQSQITLILNFKQLQPYSKKNIVKMAFNLSKLNHLFMSTFRRPSLLQSLNSYKNSPAQQHLHDYVRDQQQLQRTKASKIDYDFITKESAGVMMFREFAFQEKTEQTLVPHLNCQLTPSGAWTYEQIRKQLGESDIMTRTQQQNIQIMDECQPDIEKSIAQYYTNIGKKNYQFNLQEEINKINQMTDEQFKHFAKILHNQININQEEPSKIPRKTLLRKPTAK